MDRLRFLPLHSFHFFIYRLMLHKALRLCLLSGLCGALPLVLVSQRLQDHIQCQIQLRPMGARMRNNTATSRRTKQPQFSDIISIARNQ